MPNQQLSRFQPADEPAAPPALLAIASRLDNILAELGNANISVMGLLSRAFSEAEKDDAARPAEVPEGAVGEVYHRLDKLNAAIAALQARLSRMDRLV